MDDFSATLHQLTGLNFPKKQRTVNKSKKNYTDYNKTQVLHELCNSSSADFILYAKVTDTDFENRLKIDSKSEVSPIKTTFKCNQTKCWCHVHIF